MSKQQLDALRAALGDDEFKKFISEIAGTNERAQGLIARALEDGEGAEVETPVIEEPAEDTDPPAIEIDDETVKLIATEVVRQLGETVFATANGAIEKHGKEIAKLATVVDGLVATQRKVSGRVEALEADEDAKRQTWLGDLPQRRQTIAVTHRPRQERPVEDVLATSDQIAASTLANLPMPPGLKS